MKLSWTTAFALALGLGIGTSDPRTLVAQEAPAAFRAGPIVVEAPWARATPGGVKVAGGYMRITNTGQQSDRLIGGAVEMAGGFELHRSSIIDGVARMEPLTGGLEIGPGQTVELKPGALHAMFVDLNRPLRQGETLKGTLAFERAGIVPVTYDVGSIGAQGAPSAHANH